MEEEQIEEIVFKNKLKNKGNNWEELLGKNKWPLGLGLIGLVIIIAGLYVYFRSTNQEETSLEIIPAKEEKVPETSTIWVEIAGAVEKPGIYELAANSRINDLLIKAGGLSALADRQWLEKSINLAQKLSDGIKIYLPRQGEVIPTGSSLTSLTGIKNASININTASETELDQLWGIGEMRAKEIMANRPYQSIEELKTKNIIPTNVFEKIKDKISVF